MWDSNGNIRLEEKDSLPHCNVTRRNVSFSINWLDFLRSFVTTGYRFSRKYWYNPTIPHYIQMYWNQNLRRIFLYRFAMAHSIGQLLKVNNGNLSLDDTYEYLDPSEKRVWSYMLGMAFTNLIAELHYNVIYLQNLDYAIQQDTIRVFENSPNSNSLTEISLNDERPDFIGQKIDGSWVVFEAKGWLEISKCSSCRKSLEEATKKARKVRRIQLNGISYDPNLCVGSALINRQRLSLCTCDPSPEGTLEVNIENYGKFIFLYYKLMLDFIQENREEKEISGIPFLVSTIKTPKECENVYMVGIYQYLYEELMKVKESEFKEQLDLITLLKSFNDKLEEKEIEIDTEKVSIGKDGIIVTRR